MQAFDANLAITKMTSDHIAVVSDIEQRSYRFPWSKVIFEDCIQSAYKCFVLKINHDVIGYAVLSLSKFDAQILNLCVDKEFRCLGYAEKLLNFLISEVRELKINEMFLEVRPSNSEAVSLYLKKGFEKIGSRKNYYRSEDGREDADIYLLNIKKIGYIS